MWSVSCNSSNGWLALSDALCLAFDISELRCCLVQASCRFYCLQMQQLVWATLV
jgi:hypothetical protein